MNGLPRGWQSAALGDVCTITSGATPKTSTPEYWGGDIPWVTPNDMSKDRSQTLLGGERSLTEAGYASCSARKFPPGSVIVSSRAPVGYVAIAGREMCTNQGCKTATPPTYLDSRYLYWFLVNAKSDLEARASGTTFKEVSTRRFAETRLNWPDLAEQRRIVDILEEHLTSLDDAHGQLRSARQRLRGLRDRTVRDALTGTQVRGPRQPAMLPGVGTNDGHLVALPAGWVWARLGEVAEVVGGVTKDIKKQSDPALPEVPYLRVANVQRGRIDLTQVTKIRVSREKAAALTLRPGDILLNEGGDRDKLGRGWVWEGQVEGCIHQNHVFRARLTDHGLDPYFVSWTTNSFGGRWAERNGKQSVNLASISLSKIRLMPVIVPPQGVAKAVAAKLADDMASFDRLESEVLRAQTRGGQLRRSLLDAAFSGMLTGRSSDAGIIEELADQEEAS